MIELNIQLNKFTLGKGVWKFNNSLLKIPDFLELINKAISDEILKYAIPIYSFDFIEKHPEALAFTIDDDLLLEVLFLRIRGETIKFASALKKRNNERERELEKDIEYIEMSPNLLKSNEKTLKDKKLELENLREIKVKGELVRSRLQWLTEGERPSKYFCSLDNRNYIDKTIKKVQLPDGSFVTEQKQVLHHIRNFYSELFNDKEVENDENIFEMLNSHVTQKVDNLLLGEPVTIDELGAVLKKMKPNKSPGIDGITAEFIKVFWGKLKYFIANSIKTCFEKGTFSTTFWKCLITCLPKGNKDRKLLKNWRPISLLCVIYKLPSGTIANRIKPTVNGLISNSQCGFLPGRQISDVTILIYDLMVYTEQKNIPGLLMLVDFEKAFDSVSWKFLYKTLNFFGFDHKFIKWIQLFNKDITAHVIQCGFLSHEIEIKRGCCQGDPIAAYLFLICAEVLSILIKTNPNISGIQIKDFDFNLTQFADDTTIILDGTQQSLQATLNTLEVFGNYSGLRMNKEKTKIVWIGRKRFSKEKLKINQNLDWGSTEFKLLGIEFSTNIANIPELNFKRYIERAKTEIKNWSSRNITPFGKITVIKMFVISPFVHLFLTIPTSHQFIKDLNNLLYKFLWNNKPDKINRETVCSDYFEGGLKMVNIFNFERALKLSWIRKLYTMAEKPWYYLFFSTYDNFAKFFKLGVGWTKFLLKAGKNKFWQQVFENWITLNSFHKVQTNTDIMESIIWYNTDIFKTDMYYPHWFKKGIHCIGDLVKSSFSIWKK